MSVLDAIAKRIEEKPIPSMIAIELLKLIEDEDHSLKEVVRLVENDASLTSEVLKVANTPAYFRGQPATTVQRAVLLLGEMMVVGIAICASSSIVFHSPLEGYDSATGEMWDHSVRSAIASRSIAKYTKKKVSPGLAFTAGLLHDIGKSVLSEFLVGHGDEINHLQESAEDKDFLEMERDILGTDHTKVGFALAKSWKLPEPFQYVIRDHHNPSQTKEEYLGLVYTVHLADLISMLGGAGTGSDSLSYKVASDYEEHVQISKEELSLILLDVQEEFTVLKESILSK